MTTNKTTTADKVQTAKQMAAAQHARVADETVNASIRNRLARLCLEGAELESVFNLVLGIMTNGTGNAFEKYAYHMGYYTSS